MPHLKSAKKRLRQNLKRRDHNRAIKKALKKNLKLVFEAGPDQKATVEQMKKDATAAVKKLDKAAAKGVIHRNNAARRKSRLMRMVAKASALAADPDVARWNQASLSSGQLAHEYGFVDVDGSAPDAWRYIVEVQDAGKPPKPEAYR